MPLDTATVLAWIGRLLPPLLLADLFLRRLPHAHAGPPPSTRTLSVFAALPFLSPGDVLVCKGASTDSCSVAGWSCSPFTHVALVGPDLFVYDITPVEHERRMTLFEYVRRYDGHVVWRRARFPAEWHDVPRMEFRESLPALLAATLSETPIRPLADRCAARMAPERAYCSEYVCRVLGLPGASVSHPKNFLPDGRYGARWEGLYALTIRPV
jgi:hypothetical protein